MAAQIKVMKRGEGEALWVLGLFLCEIKVTSADSGGGFVVAEFTIPPNSIGSPLHTHPGTETVHVLEGSVRFYDQERTLDCDAGSEIHIPKDTWEWFENVTARPARTLVTYTPGQNMDLFFRELSEPATTRTLPPPSRKMPDFVRAAAIAKKYGMELKPPPERRVAAQPMQH